MADLLDRQFELDGVVFGVDCPIEVESCQPGRAELITQRQKNDSGDGVRMGKDFYGSSTWSFRLFTNSEDAPGALASYEALSSVWPTDDVRLSSDTVSTLRYRFGDRTRIVYGRGGRWTPTLDTRLWSGYLAAAADFETVDHLYYDDEVNTEIIPIAQPLSTGGMIPPVIPPFVSTGVNPERFGDVTIGGDRPTPVWITVEGPISDPKIIAPGRVINGKPWAGWVAQLNDTVYPDDPVTIDARPWARSATRQSGGGVRVSARVTQISKLYLPPGRHTLSFSGIDPTGTATAAVSWRNARSSL